jgi:hyperosmotically inducible protein
MKALWTIAAAILVMGAMPVWTQAATDQSPSQPASRNEELERKILANLLANHDLKNNRIDVTVEGTTVTLKGKVDSDAERATASRLAQVEGIAIVHDQLEVGSQGVKEVVTDTAVTTELKAQFLADTTLRHATISVATNNGVVTLQGVVPTRAARAKAVALATRLKGVSRVEDDLQLPPKDVAP